MPVRVAERDGVIGEKQAHNKCKQSHGRQVQVKAPGKFRRVGGVIVVDEFQLTGQRGSQFGQTFGG